MMLRNYLFRTVGPCDKLVGRSLRFQCACYPLLSTGNSQRKQLSGVLSAIYWRGKTDFGQLDDTHLTLTRSLRTSAQSLPDRTPSPIQKNLQIITNKPAESGQPRQSLHHFLGSKGICMNTNTDKQQWETTNKGHLRPTSSNSPEVKQLARVPSDTTLA